MAIQISTRNILGMRFCDCRDQKNKNLKIKDQKALWPIPRLDAIGKRGSCGFRRHKNAGFNDNLMTFHAVDNRIRVRYGRFDREAENSVESANFCPLRSKR
jgi:hypothetical protein